MVGEGGGDPCEPESEPELGILHPSYNFSRPHANHQHPTPLSSLTSKQYFGACTLIVYMNSYQFTSMTSSSSSSLLPPICPFTTALFIGSTLYYISYARKLNQNHHDNTDTNTDTSNKSCTISSRGILALSPVLPYFEAFSQCLENPCDAVDNPEGYIALCVAENKLAQEVFANRLMRPSTALEAFSDSVAYNYNGMLGLPIAREAVARFLEKRFLLSPRVQGGGGGVLMSDGERSLVSSDRINPEHIAIAAGASSILNHLFFSISEPGEGVLIPAPFYAAFVSDMKVVAGCIPIPVHSANPVRGPTVDELEAAKQNAERNLGVKVKIFLITNPNNPLGVAYDQEMVRKWILWARSYSIHCIVDEIYALSMHQVQHKFVSVIRILENVLDDDVHFVWALSKDFGASGFRIGVLYSQNEDLLQALSNLSIFSCVSHPMQLIMADILLDDAFVEPYLISSRKKLRQSYALCTAKLDEMVIDYVPADAGIFVYCDFSSLLPEQTFEAERKLRKLIETYARVVLTPGESQYDRKPGRFRICYAWVGEDVLEIAMERLSFLIIKLRKMDWINELHVEYLSDVIDGAAQRVAARRRLSMTHQDSIDLTRNLS